MLFISEKTVQGHQTNSIQKLELPKEKKIIVDMGHEADGFLS